MRFLSIKKYLFPVLIGVFVSGNLIAQDSIPNPQEIPAKKGVIKINQDKRITELLRIKKSVRDNKTYKIQIYNGNLKGAEEAKEKFELEFEEQLSCDISYEAPNFKVWIGKFRTRLEADRQLIKIRKKHPQAFILFQ